MLNRIIKSRHQPFSLLPYKFSVPAPHLSPPLSLFIGARVGNVSLGGFPFVPGLYRYSIGGLGAGRIAYWLEGCGCKITPLLIFNSKVITFTHLFLGYISFLNLCRLFSHIGYAVGHFKETLLTIHNRPRVLPTTRKLGITSRLETAQYCTDVHMASRSVDGNALAVLVHCHRWFGQTVWCTHNTCLPLGQHFGHDT